MRRLAMTCGLPFVMSLFLAAGAMPVTAEMEKASIRVACVGDSITFGDRLPRRGTQAYPAVLAALAGERWQVENYGVNGFTALPGTGRCWLDTPAAEAALASAPDNVIILLGTNDLGFPNRYHEYPEALRALIQRFRQLPSAPRIFLCTLPPIAPEENPANRIIRETMIPAIQRIAQETGCTLIDLNPIFPATLEWLPDGVHPSPAGAERIARTIHAALTAP